MKKLDHNHDVERGENDIVKSELVGVFGSNTALFASSISLAIVLVAIISSFHSAVDASDGWATIIQSARKASVAWLLLAYLLSGFLLSVFLVEHHLASGERIFIWSIRKGQSWEKDWRAIGMILCLALGLPFFYQGSQLLSITMQMIGVRDVKHHVVAMNSENYSRIEVTSAASGIPVHSCKHPSRELWLVEGIDIDWHGIGSTTQIRLLGAVGMGTDQTTVSVGLDANGVWPLRGASSKWDPNRKVSANGVNCWTTEIDEKKESSASLSAIAEAAAT